MLRQAQKNTSAASPRPVARGEIRPVNPPLTPAQDEEWRTANAAAWKKIRREYDEAFRILAKM